MQPNHMAVLFLLDGYRQTISWHQLAAQKHIPVPQRTFDCQDCTGWTVESWNPKSWIVKLCQTRLMGWYGGFLKIGYPQSSSILAGFSITIWGNPILGNLHILQIFGNRPGSHWLNLDDWLLSPGAFSGWIGSRIWGLLHVATCRILCLIIFFMEHSQVHCLFCLIFFWHNCAIRIVIGQIYPLFRHT